MICSWIATVIAGIVAPAQSSSLWQTPGMAAHGQRVMASPYSVPAGTEGSPFSAAVPLVTARPVTTTVERVSLIGVPLPPPRKCKVNDLINIIVRQQKKYEADGKLDTKKEWSVNGKLQDWFRFYPGNKLGTDKLSNGKPGFDYDFKNRLKTDAENQREDKFTTRLQARVIDVKPNGSLVLEATMTEAHDEEQFTITLTGTCRSEDVTADNSILSTQIAEMMLVEKNTGAVRDSTSRGWIPKLLDWIKPF